jgi:folate-dependent phosphoribosylglycinamide formyltransferase PurN
MIVAGVIDQMVKWFIAALVLIVVVLGLGWYSYSQHSKAAALSLQVDSLNSQLAIAKKLATADRNSIEQRSLDAQAAKQRKELADEATKKALKSNPDWATSVVPDDVLDAIGM